MYQEKNSPVLGYCRNCGQKIMGYRNVEGLLKIECPFCHTRYVSQQKSRRHIIEDIYAPTGEEIINYN